jgi:hypothetical protein
LKKFEGVMMLMPALKVKGQTLFVSEKKSEDPNPAVTMRLIGCSVVCIAREG